MLPSTPSHIHLIGIGGVGMSAIARVLLDQGYHISGSDRALNSYTDALERDGAIIYAGHEAAHIADNPPDCVLISSAIKGNPEVEAAEKLGIPVYKRSDIIADLMRGQTVIAVAGSHGKTTTTAMIAHILIETGVNPGYIIGGTLKTTGTNASAGGGKVFVVEADEYDYMFLGLRPNIAVVTNIEWDHPDFFKTADDFLDAFLQFVSLVPENGQAIFCADDPGALNIRYRFREELHVLGYGARDSGGWLVKAITPQPDGTSFKIVANGYQSLICDVHLRVPGQVNVLNAVAAVRASQQVGIKPSAAAAALATFTGVSRRFDLIGEINSVAVIDDYAHNPTKIRAVLEAARSRYPDRQIWAIWQPHTYSRTQTFLPQYADAFSDADHVLVTEIYAAREQGVNFPGITGETTAAAIRHPDARFTPSFDSAVQTLLSEVAAPAAIVLMSAGDGNRIGYEYLNFLKLQHDQDTASAR